MRKLWLISVACLVVLAAAMAVTAVAAAPKGDKVTITGEPVDLWCYMAAGAKGADHKACATACANSGLPIGILDAKGDVYLAMGAKDMENAKDLLAKRVLNPKPSLN